MALKMLAEGRLSDVSAEPLPEMTAAPSADRAVEALLNLLLRGVRALAQQLSAPAAVETSVVARQLFQRVKALCIDKLPDPFGDGRPAYSVFAGPLHLANLLIAAERDLGGAALSHLPAPTGADTACTAPGFLDTRLHYAARLRLVSRRAARASSGLR